MEREDHIDAALIDLGAVAEETKGSNVIMDDRHGGQLPGLGLSDD
ncbi:benenodin family lasso peptide [Sphingobium sp. H39-3-25]|nr:benenodin family lasso peptide [Sphingobium arseniciresistens]|tara:strand:+ start:41791 stop:41925 length:135 start_codon:yes stop_codon:yes gene_type:complete